MKPSLLSYFLCAVVSIAATVGTLEFSGAFYKPETEEQNQDLETIKRLLKYDPGYCWQKTCYTVEGEISPAEYPSITFPGGIRREIEVSRREYSEKVVEKQTERGR